MATSAVELLNNLLLDADIRRQIAESPGRREQLRQLAVMVDGLVAEGLASYEQGGGEVVTFENPLSRAKAVLGMACLMDEFAEVFKTMMAAIKLKTAVDLTVRVKDQAFVDDIVARLEYAADVSTRLHGDRIEASKTGDSLTEGVGRLTRDKVKALAMIMN